MKKITYIISVILLVVILTGCTNKESVKNIKPSEEEKKKSVEISDNPTEEEKQKAIEEAEKNVKNIEINAGEKKVLHCTRDAGGRSGMSVYLNYYLTVSGKYINEIHSIEEVVTTNKSDLDEYEKAYKTIKNHYDGIKYYEINVERTDNHVLNDLYINYDKVDIKKIIEIEGEEDNIFENNKARFDKWQELASKFGTKCEEE